MLFLPVSFFAAFLLATFLLRLLRREEEGRPALPFLVLLAVMVGQLVLVGLRWGYGVTAVMRPMAVMASVIPPLAYLAFSSLAAAPPRLTLLPRRRFSRLVHALPPLLVLVLNILETGPIDAVLILTFAGYGAALLWLARLGPDGLSASRLDGALRSFRALQWTGLTLIASAISDILISLDFAFGTGSHAPAVITAFSTAVLLALGYAASLVEATPQEEPASETPPQPLTERSATEEETRIAEALEVLMREKQLYRDADLNLTRLARRLGLPVRAVSNAVNRVHGMSVSHYVNTYRVEDACRLLATSDAPVTRIALDSGFMTKSNFNREFLRVTGMSPSVWRGQKMQRPVVSDGSLKLDSA
ncbi:helix-turn-helix domain-containing protein [Rhizobium paknamense]|uniref:AraC-like DNA-binding protein n=1 Tax=Rhizobium paknamense TaxID=1206817 RepID=A0ABU0IAM4_9HYPH|nr:helix-turn-helix domain-containing protein [Rhizobium paknamense]MDQ0454341.1 AraC-like DNA-binding protein [Rhizobium paknamense]